MNIWEYDTIYIVMAIVIGYFVGTITFGAIVAKIKGINLRSVGSGNIGATNASRAMGAKWGIIITLLDALKSVIAATIMYFIVPNAPEIYLAAATFAMIGHCYPVWLKFKGGKGAATFLGFSFVVLPPLMLLALVIVSILILKATKMVSIISLMSGTFVMLLIVLSVNLELNNWIYGTAENAILYVIPAYSILLWRHRGNIKRLVTGNENKL